MCSPRHFSLLSSPSSSSKISRLLTINEHCTAKPKYSTSTTTSKFFDEIVAGIRAALAINSIDPGVIAIEARRSIEHTGTSPPTTLMERPPSLADYDTLLNRKNQP
jgi:hypothetical protein